MKRFSFVGFVAVAAAIALVPAASAVAATSFDANLVVPGVYYGTGNSNGHFTVNTDNGGVEMGLRGHVYKQAPGTPVGNEYDFALGEKISFDWSFNSNGASLDGVTQSMTILNVGTGGSFTFDPSTWPDNSTFGAGTFQNSWRLEFGFLNGPGGLGYNMNDNATYQVSWNVSGGNLTAMNDTIILKQGTGAVPEPATWAMMIIGFGIAGGALRRKHASSAARALA